MKDELLCVRGNCDAEVDQMVLEFPILADYMIMYFEGHMAFITHGHIHNQKKLTTIEKRRYPYAWSYPFTSIG